MLEIPVGGDHEWTVGVQYRRTNAQGSADGRVFCRSAARFKERFVRTPR